MRRVVISLIATAAIVGLAFGFSSSRKPPKVLSESSVVLQRTPAEGDLDLRQTVVSVKLAPGYTGDLLVDGQVVPDEDLHREPALYQITLQPQNGSPFVLGPGRHCASVRYWPLTEPTDRRDYPAWCFNLH